MIGPHHFHLHITGRSEPAPEDDRQDDGGHDEQEKAQAIEHVGHLLPFGNDRLFLFLHLPVFDHRVQVFGDISELPLDGAIAAGTGDGGDRVVGGRRAPAQVVQRTPASERRGSVLQVGWMAE